MNDLGDPAKDKGVTGGQKTKQEFFDPGRSCMKTSEVARSLARLMNRPGLIGGSNS
jgi:hypothetical protein